MPSLQDVARAEIARRLTSRSHAPGEAWRRIARPSQLPPAGPWFVWVAMAGRGWGKSRTGGEWLDSQARQGKRGDQVLVAGRTPSDVRDYALNGEGGLLRHHPDIDYLPTKRLLVWPNGVEGLIRSGANPEEFRGFSGEKAWLDEFAAWDYPAECWDNLILGLRERNPQVCITTTPRPIPVLKEIMAMPAVVVVRGTSYENLPNLSDVWRTNVLDPMEGTRKGRQEIGGELLEDVEGALWKLGQIDALRCKPEDVPELRRIVVGVDPQGTKATGHETGIVCVGKAANGDLYVIEDASLNGTPNEWAGRTVAVYDKRSADRIVAEKNFGGEMVESTVRSVRASVSFSFVVASRGKQQRAEPIAALYEQGKVHHVGTFPALEDEMCSFTPASSESPNRMDALVWAATELIDESPMPTATRAAPAPDKPTLQERLKARQERRAQMMRARR